MRWLIIVPLLLLLVLFALSNAQSVDLTLWPTDLALRAPLSLAVLGTAALAFLAGAALNWMRALGARRRGRRAEDAVRLLEAQVAALKQQLPASRLPPP